MPFSLFDYVSTLEGENTAWVAEGIEFRDYYPTLDNPSMQLKGKCCFKGSVMRALIDARSEACDDASYPQNQNW